MDQLTQTQTKSSSATATARSVGAEPQAKKNAKQRDREARLARKLERADDLDHLLLWLRSDDAQVLRSMLYAFDRSCAKIRSTMASLVLSLTEGQAALAQASDWLMQLEGLSHRTNGQEMPMFPELSVDGGREPDSPDLPKSPQEKAALRTYRRAIATQYGVDFYLPRSQEGRRFALALLALDGQLIRARTVDALDETGLLLTKVGRLIREGHDLTARLAQLANVSYEPHPLIRKGLKAERNRSLVQEVLAEAAGAALADADTSNHAGESTGETAELRQRTAKSGRRRSEAL